ncbi:hypothetical protein QQZ08_010076 [Neonectria magnoliae]|uniref:Uncharacterized protein n=1 Tax=Neonectria magnoliae TaxID=2732573 RepID=A0ABR1HIY1_9HYPO
MCPDNTSGLLYGVPTARYLQAPDGEPNRVYFHGSYHGLILWALATEPEMASVIANLSAEGDIPEKVRKFLCTLWECCEMEGPDRRGLEAFRATWLRLVMNIAQASCHFQAATVDREVLDSWEIRPLEAYSWLKEQYKLRRSNSLRPSRTPGEALNEQPTGIRSSTNAGFRAGTTSSWRSTDGNQWQVNDLQLIVTPRTELRRRGNQTRHGMEQTYQRGGK